MKFESTPFKIMFFDFRSVWRAGIVSWAIIGFKKKMSGFEALVVAAQFAQSLLLLRTIATYCALSGTTAAQNQLLISLVSESESYEDISFVGRGGCDHKWELELFSVGFSSPAQRSLEKSAEGFEFGPRDIGFLQNIGANDKDKRGRKLVDLL